MRRHVRLSSNSTDLWATSRSTQVHLRTPQRRRTFSSLCLGLIRGGWADSIIGLRLLIASESTIEEDINRAAESVNSRNLISKIVCRVRGTRFLHNL